MKKNGYMTVEASLVMFVVLMVYVFIIRYALWGYDRCMMEFDMATFLLRSYRTDEADKVWLAEKAKWDKEKYIWIKVKEPVLKKEMLQLSITVKGDGGSMGETGISYKMLLVKPQELIRAKRKTEKEDMQKGDVKK